MNTLPKDSRTLLNISSTKTANIKIMKPGKYYHFGLENGIRRHSLNYNLEDDIKIIVGVDGLPLSKSSSSEFWPILAYIHPQNDKVFPIGIYHGYEKPHDSNDFMKYFIEELKFLIINGIIINNNIKKISLYAFCCDAPAKSFVLKTKGHTGFSSCTRCFQTGEYLNNRTCFPYLECGSKKRDHVSYITMVQKNHHTAGGKTSNLVEIPNFNMVLSFPLDYMHLVLLGVMRKLIHLWLHKGPLSVRLSSRQVFKISESLLSLKPYIPIEFARKPRIIQEISRWKATELRLFLL